MSNKAAVMSGWSLGALRDFDEDSQGASALGGVFCVPLSNLYINSRDGRLVDVVDREPGGRGLNAIQCLDEADVESG